MDNGNDRRRFLKRSGTVAAGAIIVGTILPACTRGKKGVTDSADPINMTIKGASISDQAIHEVNLSSLNPSAYWQQWGWLRFDTNVKGNPLRIGDRQFTHGLGTHAKSYLVYDLDGKYKSFEAWVGVDADMKSFGTGSIIFQVLADGKVVFDSGTMKNDTPAKQVQIDVSGVKELRLLAEDAGDGHDGDYANWAEGMLIPVKPIKVDTEIFKAKMLAGQEDHKTLTSIGHKQQDTWTLKNDSVAMDVVFNKKSLRISSFENRQINRDYLDDSGPMPLFTYDIDGEEVKADDGKWEMLKSDVSDILRMGMIWGKSLAFTLKRLDGPAVEVTAVFEVYNSDSGVRFYTLVRNLSEEREMRISESTVFAMPVSGDKRTLYYATEGIDWDSNLNKHRGKINCIVQYDSGDGWFIAPENNHCTSLKPGPFAADPLNPLLFLDVDFDAAGDRPGICQVESNTKAIQLVLFPQEQVEYFAVNLGTFVGDLWDGRFAVSCHLRERFKFVDPTRKITSNDWYWHRLRQDNVLREKIVPILTNAGFDNLLIDDLWYPSHENDLEVPEWANKQWRNQWGKDWFVAAGRPSRDVTEPKPSFTTDLPKLAEWIEGQGLGIGYWFGLNGDYWGNGRSLADPRNIDFKISQTQDILIDKYRGKWQQLDLGELFLDDPVDTQYSHSSDNVYRKWLGYKKFCRTITESNPDYMIQETCEFENPAVNFNNNADNQSASLLGLPENGIAGLFWRAKGAGAKDLFHYHGIYPSEGMLAFWDDNQKLESMNMIYQFLTARHQSVYNSPQDWTMENIELCRLFNEWRKSPRINAISNEPIRPTYSGGTWKDAVAPYVWMFTDKDKDQALVLAVGDANANQDAFEAPLRWVAADKSYAVCDISLDDDAKFRYQPVGISSGAELKKGMQINLNDSISKTRAFWLQAVDDKPCVVYADHHITRFEESTRSNRLDIDLYGTKDTEIKVITADPKSQQLNVHSIVLDQKGQARLDIK